MVSTARGRDDHLGSKSCVERRPQTQRPVHRSDPYASSLLARLANRLASSVSSIFSSSASSQSDHSQPQATPRLSGSSLSRLLHPIPGGTPVEADSSSQLPPTRRHCGRGHRQSSFLTSPAPSFWSARQNKPVHGIRPSASPLSPTALGTRHLSPDVSSLTSVYAALPAGSSAGCSQFDPATSPSSSSGSWDRRTPAHGAYSVPSFQQSSESARHPLAFGRRGTSHTQRAPFQIPTSAQKEDEPQKERSKPFAESLFESQQRGTLGLAASSRATPSPVVFPRALQLHGHQTACERATAPVVVQEKEAFSRAETAETGRASQHFSSFPSCLLGSRSPPHGKQQRRRRPLASAREPAAAVSEKVERGSTAPRCAARKQRLGHEKAADTTLPPVPLLGKLRSNLSAEASLGPGGRLFQENLTVDQLQRLYLRCQPLRWRVKLRQLFCQEAEHYDSSTSGKEGSQASKHGRAELGQKTAGSTSSGIPGVADDAAQRGKSRLQQRGQSGGEEREATRELPEKGELFHAAEVGGVVNGRSADRSPDGVTTGAPSGSFSLADGKAGPTSGSDSTAASGGAESSGSDEAFSAAPSGGQPHHTGDASPTRQAGSQSSHSFDTKNAERSDEAPASTVRSAGKSPIGTQPDAADRIFGGSPLFGTPGGCPFSFSPSQTKTSLVGDIRTSPHEASSGGSSEVGVRSLVPKSAHTAVLIGEGGSAKPSNSNEERTGAGAAPATSTFGRSGDTTTAGREGPSSGGLFMKPSGGVSTSPSESLPTFGRPAPANAVFGSQQKASLFSSTSSDSFNASALSTSGKSQPSKLGGDKQGAGERPGIDQPNLSGGMDTSAGTATAGVMVGDKPKGEMDEKAKDKGVGSADNSAPGSTSDGTSSSAASALPWWQQNVGKACLVQVEDDGFAPDDEKDDGEDNEEGDPSATTEKGKHTGVTPAAGSVAALAAFQPPATGSSGSIFGTYSASKSTPAPAATATSIFGSSSGVFSSLCPSSTGAASTPAAQSQSSAGGSTSVPSLFVFGGGANTATSSSNSGSLFGSSAKDKPLSGNSLFGGSVAVKPTATLEAAGPGSGAGQPKQAGAGGLDGASSSIPDEPGTAKKTGLFVFGSAPTQQPSTTGNGGGGGKRGREGREEDGGQPAMKSVFGGAHGGGGLFGSITSVTPPSNSAALTTLGTNPAAETSSGSAHPFGFSRVGKDSSGVSATLNPSLFGNRSATPVFGLGADSRGGGSSSGAASGSSLFGSSNTTTGNPFRFGGQSLAASAGSSVFGISSNTSGLFGASSSSTASATGASPAAGSGSASSQARPSTTSFFSFSSAPSSIPAGASSNLGGRSTFGSSSGAQPFGLSSSGAGGDTGQASEGVPGRPVASMFSGSGAGGGGSQAEGNGLLAAGAVVRRPRLTIKRTKN